MVEYNIIYEIGDKWFLKKLNEKVREGWKPIYNTFRVGNYRNYTILLVKENQKFEGDKD